jgi:hypothetical protein
MTWFKEPTASERQFIYPAFVSSVFGAPQHLPANTVQAALRNCRDRDFRPDLVPARFGLVERLLLFFLSMSACLRSSAFCAKASQSKSASSSAKENIVLSSSFT